MSSRKRSPYGSWKSPLSAADVAAGQVALGQVEVSGGMVYWTETRPAEGGRVAIMKTSMGENPIEATPPGFNCRTRVHEYGGGAYLVHGSVLYCASYEDQRLYRIEPGAEPLAVTPEPPCPAGYRYADGRMSAEGDLLICVREDHSVAGEPTNELVTVSPQHSRSPKVLHRGHDFYSSPRIGPDGSRLAWITWDHPRMPWEGSQLWTAELDAAGGLSAVRPIAGGEQESIVQPEWSPEGILHFVSDRSGWWNLYRLGPGGVVPVMEMEAEFGSPAWVFGFSRYAFLDDGRIAAIYTQRGIDHLALLSPQGTLERLATEWTSLRPPSLRYDDRAGRIVFIGSNPGTAPTLISLDPASGEQATLRTSSFSTLVGAFISSPRSIEYPSADGRTAHAFFYPPSNPDHAAPQGERPPLIVISHGGPTSQTRLELSLSVQYWTTRGFAVVDVNYGGSTGYGREYRELLEGQWGIVDVEDCIHAALHLANRGEVDPKRLIIRGGSAGGYTTLCALVFHEVFAAGASYYGIADLEALARETHKFESRYLDSMVGPYPEMSPRYRERSPIHFASMLSCPVILFQGLEDRVVPPQQAEIMVEALNANGLPHAYIAFEGEAHGFRSAENIQRALEAELYFYSRIFGFELADPIEPLEIANLELG